MNAQPELPTTKRKPARRLSTVETVLANHALTANQKEFLETRPTHEAAAKRLSELVGFGISSSTIITLQRSSGVVWHSRKPKTEPLPVADVGETLTLAECLMEACVKNGLIVPAKLAGLIDSLEEQKANS